MILRKDAGAGRAGAASLPTRRNLSAAPSAGEEATRQRAIRRARQSARGFRGRTRRAVLSPVAQPPGEDYGRGRKGAHTSALDVERAEIPGNAASCFFPYAEQPPRCSLRGFPSQEGRIRGDQAARRAVFSHMRDSRRADYLGPSPLQEGRIRGNQPARRAVFSHTRDSRRAELPGRSLPSAGRWIQRDQAASDTEEAAAQTFPFVPANAADDVERAGKT